MTWSVQVQSLLTSPAPSLPQFVVAPATHHRTWTDLVSGPWYRYLPRYLDQRTEPEEEIILCGFCHSPTATRNMIIFHRENSVTSHSFISW